MRSIKIDKTPPTLRTVMPPSKVYWIGNHTTRPAWGAPVSKVHKAGLQLLNTLGWTQVPNDHTGSEPVFAFTTRKGANYPAEQPGLPTVRQLPHDNTACLDDKCRMAQCLTAAGFQHLMPFSWSTMDAYLVWLREHLAKQQGRPQRQGDLAGSQQQCALPNTEHASASAGEASAGAAVGASSIATSATSLSGRRTVLQTPLPGGSVFIKHRRGVKGQAIYVVHTLEEVQQLQQRLKCSSRDFVVQQEVQPMLIDGRKFVLRMHVLISAIRQPQHSTRCQMADFEQQHIAAGDAREARLRMQHYLDAYVHEDVISVQHAQTYAQGSRDAAVNISSKGQHHPVPVLLQQCQLALELRAQLWAQLQQLVAQCIDAVADTLMPTVVHPNAVLYHLFGFDCIVNSCGKAVLLEVNSYPAIASGTMLCVDVGVYTRLIEDIVRLLVLPVSDGAKPDPGGFVRVYRR